MLPKVIKRDGVGEKFSLINIAKVAVAAGLSPDQARVVAENISTWSETVGNSEITSIQIRDKMIEELEKINQNAADLYRWYEQSKEQN